MFLKLISFGILNFTRGIIERHEHALRSDARRAGRTKPLEVVEAVHEAFSQRGIVFVDDGVHRRKHQIRVLEGQKGFWDFYDDVYETVRAQGGDILISGVVEPLFYKWMGEKRETHGARMAALKNFTQKIIVQEGEAQVNPYYKTTEYRTLSQERFSGVPFYLYGRKLAIINFDPDNVQVFIIDQPNISNAYEKMFYALWSLCERKAESS